jgi:hypothetical protein
MVTVDSCLDRRSSRYASQAGTGTVTPITPDGKAAGVIGVTFTAANKLGTATQAVTTSSAGAASRDYTILISC